MRVSKFFGLLFIALLIASNAGAQDITFYFSAGDFSGQPDRFGNTFVVGPASAIDPRPFGNEALADVYFDEDNLWLIYKVEGNTLLVSHAPGYWEDAPEIYMEITAAMAGKYEVIFNFLDSNTAAGEGPIQAALGDAPLQLYDGNNTTRATGGTSPGYPTVGGATSGSMFWYSVSLGEVTVDAGGKIKVRVDDCPGDKFNLTSSFDVTSTFQGVTLRVIELGGTLSEVQVSPGAHEWTTDISGNKFRTWPQDEAAYPIQEDWLTIAARVDGNGMWNKREKLGPYGPILESFPGSNNDAMPLRTSVVFARGGNYEVYLNIGDTGQANFDENVTNSCYLYFAPEGQELKLYHPNEGVFKGTPGYNDYEIAMGEIAVKDGEQSNFIIDDTFGVTGSTRSVYLGMRFVLKAEVVLKEIQISPGPHELFADMGGNQYYTWPVDAAAYPALEDWLTLAARVDGNGKWNQREKLGPYGPILESFPGNNNDAMPLRTTVIFARGGKYDAYLSVGDTGQANFDENLTNSCFLIFGFEGQELKTYHPNDGEFKGTPGYNDYEMSLGSINVANGEQKSFIIDDSFGVAGSTRSVYLGMRFVVNETAVEFWSLY